MRKEQRQPSAVDLILARRAVIEEAERKRRLENDKERPRRRVIAIEKDGRYGISTALREISDKLLEGKGEVTLSTNNVEYSASTRIILRWGTWWHAITVEPDDTGVVVSAGLMDDSEWPYQKMMFIKGISFSSRDFTNEFSEALVEAYDFALSR